MTAMATFKCDDCGREADEDTLPFAKDIHMRMEPGDTYTDRECPECHALCFPVDKRTLVLATFETPRFSFMSLSTTGHDALGLLAKGWKKHCKQTGAHPSYFKKGDASLFEMEIGSCFRDGDRIV